MNPFAHLPVNKRALQLYDVMHLLIPDDGDENDVAVYNHSQGDWNVLKSKSGLLWTIPTEILDGCIPTPRGYKLTDNPPQTAYQLWQWATGMGYLPEQLS